MAYQPGGRSFYEVDSSDWRWFFCRIYATITDDLSRKMSQWQGANPNATLTDIEVAVKAELAELRRQLVEAMVQEEKAASFSRA